MAVVTVTVTKRKRISACLACWDAPVVIAAMGRCEPCYAKLRRRRAAGCASWEPTPGELRRAGMLPPQAEARG